MSNDLSNQRILIVDDTPENIDLLGAVLRNYKKSVALNGEKALAIVKSENRPDLILLDVMMPGMDGFEVCRILKEDESTKDIPVVFVTAMSQVEDETRGLKLGAVDFITKPISPPVVLARVKNHLELKIVRENLAAKNSELEERNTYITDSINYARRIQNAVLHNDVHLHKVFPESFLVSFPKDIVSGDFFWSTTIRNIKLAAVVDCTGHGVPGAFMSMVANTLLNEIVNMNQITDPGRILDNLDLRVQKELRKEEETATFDGMDIAICAYNPDTRILTVAGAYRSFFIFIDGELMEIKGDRKSIGDNRKKISYTNHELNAGRGAEFYLFTDGYTDQNNSENQKFGISALRSLLQKIHARPLIEQRLILSEAFKKHIGNESQRDDVTILGIRLAASDDSKIIHYNGYLSYDIVVELGDKLRAGLEERVTPKAVKTAFFCANELLQNILHYSEDRNEFNRHERAGGCFEAVLRNGIIELSFKNIISAANYRRVKEKVEYLNSLTAEQLNEYKKNKIKEETESTSKGAGIGLAEVIRRTGNPVMISETDIDSERCFINIIVSVKSGE